MKQQLEDVAEIKAAAAKFYQTLDAFFAGDISPMAEVWSHADDVSYLGPQGGLLVGWQQVKAALEQQANQWLGGKVEPRDMHIIRNKDIGYTQNYEIGTNNIDGKDQQVMIRATNIFRKENGKWKMISHQVDLLPFLQDTLKK